MRFSSLDRFWWFQYVQGYFGGQTKNSSAYSVEASQAPDFDATVHMSLCQPTRFVAPPRSSSPYAWLGLVDP